MASFKKTEINIKKLNIFSQMKSTNISLKKKYLINLIFSIKINCCWEDCWVIIYPNEVGSAYAYLRCSVEITDSSWSSRSNCLRNSQMKEAKTDRYSLCDMTYKENTSFLFFFFSFIIKKQNQKNFFYYKNFSTWVAAICLKRQRVILKSEL